MGVESYFGAPMIDDSAEPRGLVVILDAAPAENPQALVAVLESVASRVVEASGEGCRAHEIIEATAEVAQHTLCSSS
jgi:hypothetical protein